MADRSYEIEKDAWLVRAVGGTKNYGNGSGSLITIGPAPDAVDGTVQYKGRGIYEITLRDGASKILDGITGFATAVVEMTVGPNTCIGSRGGTNRILLEEIANAFTEFNASGDCGFGSTGPATGEWGVDATVITAARALHSSGAHSTGDKLTWDVSAMLTNKLAAPSALVLRFRLIAANSDGSGYDEANTARRITLFSSEDAIPGNRPVLKLTNVATGAVAKTDAETATFTEGQLVSAGGTGPSDAEALTATDREVYAGPVPTWRVDGSHGAATLPLGVYGANVRGGEVLAMLEAVSAVGVQITHRFRFDKVPANASAYWRVLTRWQNRDNYYRAEVQVSNFSTITLRLTKFVAGTYSILSTAIGVQTLVVGDWYNLKFLAQGSGPTSLSLKLWRAGVTEPSTFQLTAQDNEATLQSAGAIGLSAGVSLGFSNPPLAIYFDDFEAISA